MHESFTVHPFSTSISNHFILKNLRFFSSIVPKFRANQWKSGFLSELSFSSWNQRSIYWRFLVLWVILWNYSLILWLQLAFLPFFKLVLFSRLNKTNNFTIFLYVYIKLSYFRYERGKTLDSDSYHLHLKFSFSGLELSWYRN